MIILGVDPGSLRTGYGAIETDGRRHRLVEKGVLAPPPRLPLHDRLRHIHAGVGALIARLSPQAIAVESVDMSFLPSVSVPLDDETGPKVLSLVDALEDSDDVQNVWANFDVSDEVLEAISG